MLQNATMHAYIPAKDVARARAFYGTSKASQAFWQVDDVEREVAELRAKGVMFEEYDAPGIKTKDGIAVAGNTKAAWFKDTEGNILALIQPLS